MLHDCVLLVPFISMFYYILGGERTLTARLISAICGCGIIAFMIVGAMLFFPPERTIANAFATLSLLAIIVGCFWLISTDRRDNSTFY